MSFSLPSMASLRMHCVDDIYQFILISHVLFYNFIHTSQFNQTISFQNMITVSGKAFANFACFKNTFCL